MSFPEGIAACSDALKRGEFSARALIDSTLSRIESLDGALRSFTATTAARACAEADAVDAARAAGKPVSALAGIPYAVKNLFDVDGVVTLAGSLLNADNRPASRDAALVRRMKATGAVLVGTTNMDAYAYGFTTENTSYGTTRNPRDWLRLAGGSSGGSGAAVAAGLCSFSLASDTNGSIRVPASFCGVFALKPTYGRLSRAGTFPFVPSLDHLGPMARSVRDLAIVYDALQGPDADDASSAQRSVERVLPKLEEGVRGLRIGVLSGYFHDWADGDAHGILAEAAKVLGATEVLDLPCAAHARAAAFVITSAEAGASYLSDLRTRLDDFEPLSRDRLIAGAMLPAEWYLRAQRFRRWFAEEVRHIFKRYDVLLAPATPCVAPTIGDTTLDLNGQSLPMRASIGLLTQPISFIGLPVAVAPLWTQSGLPLGVQIIAPPWREDLCLRAARALEAAGAARSPIAMAEPRTQEIRRGNQSS